MSTPHRLFVAAAVVTLLGAGCSLGSKVTPDSSSYRDPSTPIVGTSVALTNCKASPAILQVPSGTEVTFKNNDAVDHTLTFTSDTDTLVVKAGGSATYRPTSPVSANWTLNYLCDQTSAGAIFMP